MEEAITAISKQTEEIVSSVANATSAVSVANAANATSANEIAAEIASEVPTIIETAPIVAEQIQPVQATIQPAVEAITNTTASSTAPSVIEKTADTIGNTIIENTSPFVNWIKGFLTWDNFFKALGVALFIVILWILYKVITKAVKKIKFTKLDNHKKDLILRIIKYIFYVLVIIQILGLFGINLSALWGAAGIAGVAIGFAAQTSVSNLISGLFVITEGSLKLGDLIEIEGVKGYVDSIKLLSVRVHTFDNQMVRIPNSKIIDSNLINISYHKHRRITISVSVSYDTDMQKALDILSSAPALCPTVIDDPAPAAWFDGFADSGINMVLAVWFNADDYLKTKNDIFIAIKKVFDDAKIEIPFNQLDVKIKDN